MSPAPALIEGSPEPLGAHWDGRGVNFAVFSRHAEKVELCLFEATGQREIRRLALPARHGDIWHGYLKDAAPGLVYGYRVHGPYAPAEGHRFNPHKLLLDPWARAIQGELAWNDAVCGYFGDGHDEPDRLDNRDSAPYVPKARVVSPVKIADRPPRPHVPWRDTLVYEMHLRGFTMQHPVIPANVRGTAAALGDPTVIEHLSALGITTIELLPVAAFVDEWHLVQRGLRNFWGYNPLAPLAMHPTYLAGDDLTGFMGAVDRLHEAGLEVVLDVVFNHTAENDEFGPTLAYRGLDNAVYYRLQADHLDRYENYSGCGNTLDLSEPAVVKLVHGALRYWAVEVGVDGFRFDLAASLARDRDGAFDPKAPLLEAIANDPDLNCLKLIAEPWDLGEPGHFLGAFPAPFVEWNDRYRDGMRRFWRGDRGMLGEMATRFAGSSDIYRHNGRLTTASVNFVTAHDGFTLADLTAYENKHNEDNGEENRDGNDANWSSNAGVEGVTEDPDILERRRRLRRSLLATLILSNGTPMLLAGDELSQTQHGNNNAYCQDNPTTWLDWSACGNPWLDQVAFVRRAAALRRQLPLLRERKFFDGKPLAGNNELKDIAWLNIGAHELEPEEWEDPNRHAIGILMNDKRGPEHGQLYLAMNAGDAALNFTVPAVLGDEWLCVLDSSMSSDDMADALHAAGDVITVPPCALLALVPRRTAGLGIPESLEEQARIAGLLTEYRDISGIRRQPSAAALRTLINCVGDKPISIRSSVSPRDPQCWLPESLRQPPGLWVLSIHLYSLRSADSWGIGDYGDLARWVDIAAGTGAAGVLVSPTHAPSLCHPERASPYAPSSRLMLNPLLISVPEAARMDGIGDSWGLPRDTVSRAALEHLNTAELIDYTAVSDLKLRALREIHRAFRNRHLGAAPSALGNAFLRFRDEEGAPLRDYAVFEALSAHFAGQGGSPLPWLEWPAQFRQPRSHAVEQFERTHAEQIEFYAYLQWLARDQWQAAAERARDAGMEIGLITDLALGTDLDSAEAWQWPGLMALNAELGAPPDAFAPRGQAWGSPPWRPSSLADRDYAPFDALLEATMRNAGAIRMDHVMGLMRQFWIPRGYPPGNGTYLAYPFDALLTRVAKASQKNECMIIGEDLGNPPAGLRERMAAADMLGYRVLYFERGRDGQFIPASAYAQMAAATATTHDLPTLNGFLAGTDIDDREAHDLYASPLQARTAREDRRRALQALKPLLASYGGERTPREFAEAAHRFLAATASRLVIVQIEDVLDLHHQANLPGLGDEAPNWRRRLPLSLEELATDPRLSRLSATFAGRSRFSHASRSAP